MATISTEDAAPVIKVAQELGRSLLPVIASFEVAFQTQEEKVIFWSAFMAYLGGMAAAGIGPDALTAVAQMTHRLTSIALNEHSH